MTAAPDIQRIRQVHFVGIGGAGMSGIAEVMLNLGYHVSGSDICQNDNTERLGQLGVNIHIGHIAENIIDVELVVISSAIKKSNPEVKAAHNKRIPVIPRAQMLGELMRLQEGIAISGTHGKTTVTSLVASVLTEGGLDPTFVIGGRLNSAGANARFGSGKYFVAEADESDASFLYLQPKISVVTNIDADHMQTYQDNFDRLHNTFLDFLHHLPFYGLAIVCIDDPVVKMLLPEIGRPVITYGFDDSADITAKEFKQIGTKCSYQVVRSKMPRLSVTLNLPGAYNVLNSLAAIVVATECGVSDANICAALEQFHGVDRRFQIYGNRQFKNGIALLIDDYGHHPNEIDVTIKAVRDAWSGRRVLHVFQPHRYTRTRDLFDDFARVLSDSDMLILLDIYPAGEKPIAGISGSILARSIRQRGKVDPILVNDFDELSIVLDNIVEDGDLLLMQGAGSIGSMIQRIAKAKMVVQ